jgi:hypothetical protein
MAKGATMMDGICPMSVQGTTVTASDIDGGIALTFVTPTGDVSELRRRVHRMAEMEQVRVCVEHLKRGECPMTMPSTESSDERGRPHRASP